MGEHGVSWENMDKMENMNLGQLKMGKHQPKRRALADAMQYIHECNIYLNVCILYKIYPNVHKWRVLMRCSLVYRMLRDRGETWSHDERQLVQVAISPRLDCKSTSTLLQLVGGLIVNWRKYWSSCLWQSKMLAVLSLNFGSAWFSNPISCCPCVLPWGVRVGSTTSCLSWLSDICLCLIRSWLRDTINLILSSMNFLSWSYSS